MMAWKLKRTKQCAKCPWKVGINPHDIPDGYSVDKHQALACTIAKDQNPFVDQLNIMACHETAIEDETHCIGWINHQLGPGNNIPLRIKMISCENSREMKVFGPQHQTFEDTLPK